MTLSVAKLVRPVTQDWFGLYFWLDENVERDFQAKFVAYWVMQNQ